MGACSRPIGFVISCLVALGLFWGYALAGQEGGPPEGGAPGLLVSPPVQVAGTVIYGQTKIAFLAIRDPKGEEVDVRRVSEGETIAGFRVVEIRPNQVSFERGGETFTVPIRHKPPGVPPVVPGQKAPAEAPEPPPQERPVPGAWAGSNVEIRQEQVVVFQPDFVTGVVGVSNGVALLPGVGRLLVLDAGRLRLFDSNGSQIGIGIPIRGQASVAVSAARIIVTDEGRVRIFDPNGFQRGIAIRARPF